MQIRKITHYLLKPKLSNGDIRYFPEYLSEELKNLAKPCIGGVREMLEWVRTNKQDYPPCKHCGLPLTSKNWDDRYSVYKPFCNKSCSSFFRQHSDSYKENNLEKYGSEHPLSADKVQEKRIATNLEKYGRTHPHPWSSSTYLDMIKNKHNAESVRAITGVNNKIIGTILKKSLDKLPELIKQAEQNSNSECIDDLSKIKWVSNRTNDLILTWKHTCGNVFQSQLIGDTIKSCPRCSSGTSKLEQEIASFIIDCVGNIPVVLRSKKIIAPYELDIFIPSLNIAFEVDGSYWHSSKFIDANKATNKLDMCAAIGIKLVTIQESKWRTAEHLIKNRINNALGKITQSIGARKCSLVELTPQDKNLFFRQNHLDGDVRSSICFGLVHEDKVVAAMSFAKPRFSKHHSWEIIRFCTLTGVKVPGSLSKLLRHFQKTCCNDTDTIITYADRDWGNGSSYEASGMTFSHISKPSYVYIGPNHVRISRYQAQKKKLLKLLGPENYDPYLTESENMKKNGYLVVHDRGNSVFTLQI